MTRVIGTVPLLLTALPGLPQTQFLVPLAIVETPTGRVGIGAGDGQLFFQLYGAQPLLLSASLDELARAVAVKAQDVANSALVVQS